MSAGFAGLATDAGSSAQLQMTIEELRTTNDELVQQNTALQSANRDLQEMVENLRQQQHVNLRSPSMAMNRNDQTTPALEQELAEKNRLILEL